MYDQMSIKIRGQMYGHMREAMSKQMSGEMRRKIRDQMGGMGEQIIDQIKEEIYIKKQQMGN